MAKTEKTNKPKKDEKKSSGFLPKTLGKVAEIGRKAQRERVINAITTSTMKDSDKKKWTERVNEVYDKKQNGKLDAKEIEELNKAEAHFNELEDKTKAENRKAIPIDKLEEALDRFEEAR